MGEAPTIAVEATDDVDDQAAPEEPDVVEEANADTGDEKTDVEEAEVELSEDDFGGGELFSDVEDATDAEDVDDEGGDEEADADDDGDDLDLGGGRMEESINEGAARLAVVGLTEQDFEDDDYGKDALQEELLETFETFQLGYFGARCAEKYVLEPADGDVSPAWGLLGTSVIAAAMVVWMRPDGDEAVDRVKDAVRNIGGGEA
jgi:hypothetical protein